jgi:hypothetical protein
MNRNFAAAAAVLLSWLRHRCFYAANAAMAETVLLLLLLLLSTLQQLPAHLLPLLINPRPNI